MTSVSDEMSPSDHFASLEAQIRRTLRAQRAALHLHLSEVQAKASELKMDAKMSSATLSRIELGERLPDLQQLFILAHIYGVSIADILDGRVRI